MTKEVLFSIYDEDFNYDVDCTHYGPAITTTFKEDGQIWVTNGEYLSRVNYCPYTGEKADKTFDFTLANSSESCYTD